jgi:hypothetical protein
MSLTVTLGPEAPTLGTGLFNYVTSSKTVTVKVPSGATGYGSSPANSTDACWGNGFRGLGWTGNALVINQITNYNINLTIQYQDETL